MATEKPNTVFQHMADWINSIHTPVWLRNFLNELQEIIISVLTHIGKDIIDKITEKIIEQAGLDIPGEQKFKNVFDYVRQTFTMITIKDSALRLLIEALYNLLKKNKIIG